VRAVKVLEFGGPHVLTVVEAPDPVAGAGEVRIRVMARTVNATDTMRRSGASMWHPEPPPGPFSLGMEAAGVVDQVGAGVDLKVGDQVMALIEPTWDSGAYDELVVVPAHMATRTPSNVDLKHAATLPLNGLTALFGLELLDLPSGSTVAVTGAAGAVGGYTIELAKARGHRVIADAAPSDESLVRDLGADAVVPRGPQVAAAIRAIEPSGVLGLADCSLQYSEVIPAVADGGAIALMRPTDLTAPRGIRAIPVYTAGIARERVDALPTLREYVERGQLTPRIAAEFPLEQAAAAHQMLEQGGVRGRIVLLG
jgi:NADPH:quinone reductase-like Zn-dependent oxidoreductase